MLLSLHLYSVFAQGTAFTYQGRLNNNGNPTTGSYDLKFSLFNTNVTGATITGPVTNSATSVSNGLFTATIDFGAGVFSANTWLEIAVRPHGNGTFNTLTPRQPITPAPDAITAENVADAFTVQNNTNGAPNLIGGSSVNFVSPGVIGATIAGGGAVNSDGETGGNTGIFINSVTEPFGTVSGGAANTASGIVATVGGGVYNTASGTYSTISGGFHNTASGEESFAAGSNARAINDSSFVWSDGVDFSSTAEEQFAVHAGGGVLLAADVQIGTGSGDYHHLTLGGGNSSGFIYGSYPKFQDFITLGYNYYADASGNAHIINAGGGSSRVSVGYGEVVIAVGGTDAQPITTRLDATTSGVTVYGTFNNDSDRNVKQDFAPVSSSQILDKVLRLPVSEWSYKTDLATRHVGPMAQDFYSVFNIGTDDKHIAPIDEGGIAFAAIQGLNQKLNQKLNEKDAEIQELKQSLEDLKKTVQSLAKTN
jgi:trimeric autotransporter adhesin